MRKNDYSNLSEEDISIIKKAVAMDAVAVFKTYKISGLIGKKDLENVFVLKDDNLELIEEQCNQNWKRIDKSFFIEDIIKDKYIANLIKSDLTKTKELYKSFNIDIEIEVTFDKLFYTKVTIPNDKYNIIMWFNKLEEFVSQSII